MKIALILISLISISCSRKFLKSNPDNKNLKESTFVNDDGEITKLASESSEVVPFIDFESLKNKPKVQHWIEYFSKKDNERFQRFLNRGHFYREVVQTILEDNGLPSELYYLAMIESGFISSAKSSASAVGTWQFMSGTAKMYNLDIDRYIDERKDPIRSTEAASKYLIDLYNAFSSWELAISAYNCGEHRVLRAIMRGDSRDFWTLSEKNLLPRETRNYIPKFIAASIIASQPENYGFLDPMKLDLEKYPDVQAADIPSPVKLKDISKLTGVSLKLLERVNPHLSHKMTHPMYKNYEIWFPTHAINKLNSQQQLLVQRRVKNYKRPSRSHYHIVRRGENLGSIARKYSNTVRHLKRVNGLRSSRIYAGQKLRVTARAYKSSGDAAFYFVKRGDTLSSIAKRYSININTLKKLNRIRGSIINIGQKLVVSAGSLRLYRVRRGDNLNRIANKFGVSIDHVMVMNNLKDSTILIGQKLKI